MTTTLTKKLLWASMDLLGLKQARWNSQFKAGYWDNEERSHKTVMLAQKLCKEGRIVEFGCGTGTLPAAMPSRSFSSYLGLDISNAAIDAARARGYSSAFVGHRVDFECGTMQDWQPEPSAVSLILAEECLYYLTPDEQRVFLSKCLASLAPGGSIAVMVHSAEKHAGTIAVCRECLPGCEVSPYGHRVLILAQKES
jgi:trans-aconitate methyltransferase